MKNKVIMFFLLFFVLAISLAIVRVGYFGSIVGYTISEGRTFLEIKPREAGTAIFFIAAVFCVFLLFVVFRISRIKRRRLELEHNLR